jgi:hypothetical protein
MSFIIFILLFTVLCGWLDARLNPKNPKQP